MYYFRKRLAIIMSILMIFLFTGCPIGQNNTPGRVYRDSLLLFGYIIEQIDSGGYIIIGHSPSSSYYPNISYAALSNDGTLQWSVETSELYGISGISRSGIATLDGGVIVAGTTQYHAGPYLSEYGVLRVARIDAQGETIWDYTYGEETWFPAAISQLDDGGYIIAGDEKSDGGIYSNFFMKIDAYGNVSWRNRIDRDEYRIAGLSDMKLLPDGGLITIGVAAGGPIFQTDIVLMKADENGNIVWWKEQQIENEQHPYSIELAPDGGFFIAGTSNVKPLLLRTDADGNLLWWRDDILEAPDTMSHYEIWDMVVGDDGTIALVGEKETVDYLFGGIPVIARKAFIAVFDESGDVIWQRNLGSNRIYGMTITDHNTYMTTGTDGSNLLVVEVDMAGNIVN